MQQKLIEFAAGLGFELTHMAANQLCEYAELVWQKKDMLNLTSVSDKNEIFTRHICDGLVAAALLSKYAAKQPELWAADMGTGAGYIGITMAICMPQVQVSLVESLERRCAFLNWASMKLALQNVKVENIRVGQQACGPFHFITERAMGQLNDILPLVAEDLQQGGVFAAYQSTPDEAEPALLTRLHLQPQTPVAYTLPGETKTRYIAVFRK